MAFGSGGLGFDEDQLLGWMQQPDTLALDPGDVVQSGGMAVRDDKQPIIAAGQKGQEPVQGDVAGPSAR